MDELNRLRARVAELEAENVALWDQIMSDLQDNPDLLAELRDLIITKIRTDLRHELESDPELVETRIKELRRFQESL